MLKGQEISLKQKEKLDKFKSQIVNSFLESEEDMNKIGEFMELFIKRIS